VRRLSHLGYPGIVDNLGIEPSGRCLQDSTAHLCVALWPPLEAETPLNGCGDSNPVTLLGRQALYPLSYNRMALLCVHRAGFEPAISRLRAWRDDRYSNGARVLG
jgi:hypothetical protein